MVKRTWAVFGAGLLMACGGEAPPPKAPPPTPEVYPTPAVAERRPSPEVSRYWSLTEQPLLTLYADLSTLTRTEVIAGLVPAVMAEAGDALKGTERACVTVLLEHAEDVILAATKTTGLMALSLGVEGVKAARNACVGSLIPVERATVRGAEEAYVMGEQVLAVMPGVVLFGSKALVESALASTQRPNQLPAHFVLSGDEQLKFRFEIKEIGVAANGALNMSNEHFLLAGQFQVPDETTAEMIERNYAGSVAQAKKMAGGEGAAIGRLIEAVKLSRKGETFDVRFELRGPPVEQARDLGTLGAMSIAGVRKYVLSAKTAEAKATLAQITKSYQAAMLDADAAKPKRPKKLVSLPPVPASVPRGAKIQTAPADWAAWAPIRFGIEGSQYFQYEVVAAKDGKSAEVLARGDLNGDGKTSLYRLKILLDPKTGLVAAQALDETDPFE